MQAVKVSWIGQTFALAKCSSSRERKTRNRKTKEERKKLVESFVKKYQTSNNGNFPSLNLTHKEVGGSFYTVRELVRELIQENRVLGPGNPNSKVLNLESFSEDYEAGSLVDASNHLSILSVGHAIDQREEGFHALSTEHQVNTEQTYEVYTQGMSACHQNNSSVSLVIDSKPSDKLEMNCLNGSHLPGDLVIGEHSNVELSKLSGQPHGNSKVNQQLDPEAQGYVLDNVENTSPVSQSVSIASPSIEVALNANDMLKGSNNMGTTDSFVRHKVYKVENNYSQQYTTTKSSSTRQAIDPLYEHLVSYEIEVFPIPSVAKTCTPDGSPLQADNSNSSLETAGASERKVTSNPVGKDLIVNGIVSTENLSLPAKVQAAKSLTEASPRILAPMSTTTRIKPVSATQPNEISNLSSNRGSTSSGSASSRAKERPAFEAKIDRQKTAHSIQTFSRISGGKAKEDSGTSENQFWDILTAFVTSFIKFWTE